MVPRHLLRWKSFWLGILVLGFLAWAWSRSNTRAEGFGYSNGTAGAGVIYQGSGSVALEVSDDSMGTGFLSAEVTDKSFPPPFKISRWEVADEGRSGAVYEVAHWFLMLLFLFPWSAWLFWHWKRERKKCESR